MDIKINVKNLDKVLSQLSRLNKELEKPFQEVVKGGGQLIRAEAVKSIQSGAKSGIVLVSKIRVKQKNPNTTQVESGADYSAFLEHGTSKMLPRPFLFPAFEKSKEKIKQAVFNRVTTAIERLVK